MRAGLCLLMSVSFFALRAIGISVNMLVFYPASCVFVAPKNLLALPPLGGGIGRPAQLGAASTRRQTR